jgi:SAM-dependent methyltransferase
MHCRGHGIDIGAGRWPLPGARSIDDSEHENAYSINEPDGSLDYIFSSHTLEHLENPDAALFEWCKKLRKGGIIFLYLPHPACEMWLPENLIFHKWSPSPAILEQKLIDQFKLKINFISYLPDAYFSFVIVAEK